MGDSQEEKLIEFFNSKNYIKNGLLGTEVEKDLNIKPFFHKDNETNIKYLNKWKIFILLSAESSYAATVKSLLKDENDYYFHDLIGFFKKLSENDINDEKRRQMCAEFYLEDFLKRVKSKFGILIPKVKEESIKLFKTLNSIDGQSGIPHMGSRELENLSSTFNTSFSFYTKCNNLIKLISNLSESIFSEKSETNKNNSSNKTTGAEKSHEALDEFENYKNIFCDEKIGLESPLEVLFLINHKQKYTNVSNRCSNLESLKKSCNEIKKTFILKDFDPFIKDCMKAIFLLKCRWFKEAVEAHISQRPAELINKILGLFICQNDQETVELAEMPTSVGVEQGDLIEPTEQLNNFCTISKGIFNAIYTLSNILLRDEIRVKDVDDGYLKSFGYYEIEFGKIFNIYIVNAIKTKVIENKWAQTVNNIINTYIYKILCEKEQEEQEAEEEQEEEEEHEEEEHEEED